jgi:hypothetical protein
MPVKTDLGWGVKDQARIMPVKTPEIKYIVIHKKDKIRV